MASRLRSDLAITSLYSIPQCMVLSTCMSAIRARWDNLSSLLLGSSGRTLIGSRFMRQHWTFLVLLAGQLFLPTVNAAGVETSLDTIHQAWRNALKGVQTYGLALQALDADANSCGLDRATLAEAVNSGIKDTPIKINTDAQQLFNFFVDIATLHAGERCTSMVSLRVSAFVDPSYAALIAAEITPWSQRAIVISSKDNHRRVVEDELSKQASLFARAWGEEQARSSGK